MVDEDTRSLRQINRVDWPENPFFVDGFYRFGHRKKSIDLNPTWLQPSCLYLDVSATAFSSIIQSILEN